MNFIINLQVENNSNIKDTKNRKVSIFLILRKIQKKNKKTKQNKTENSEIMEVKHN